MEPPLQKTVEKLQIPLDTASYKLYYVNQKIGLNELATNSPVGPLSSLRLSCTAFLLLLRGLPCFLPCQFIVDVLLEESLIRAHHAAPVYKDRRCAVHLQL